MLPLHIAFAQLNCIVGDLSGNAAKILAAARQAQAEGAHLLLTPELSLCGYPPEDLLLRPAFIEACAHECTALARQLPIPTLVGIPLLENGVCYNAAVLLRQGAISDVYRKRHLPNNAVFDECRYFTPGHTPGVFTLGDMRLGIAICEDIWPSGPEDLVAATRAAGANLLLVLNASPFEYGKVARRHELIARHARANALPILYCNQVGGQDELIFDGASCAFDAQGQCCGQLPAFSPAQGTLILEDGLLLPAMSIPPFSTLRMDDDAEIYAALKLGLTDYVVKNGFPGVLLGFSGGMDSALVLALAVDALGAERVHAVMLPSPWTSQMSLDDARDMARRLGVRYDEIPIGTAMTTFSTLLAPLFSPLGEKPAWDTTDENIQARIRGLILMALSNRTGALLLNTSNKSEIAVGYGTLYGDMAGGFAVLKDVYKTRVYRLAHHRNALDPVIPGNIIRRPPSAELKPDQTDQDTLPAYEVLDAIVQAFMEENESRARIIARGHAPDDVDRVIRLLQKNEYKRRQTAPGIRISPRAFGKDWRYPVTTAPYP